MRTLTKAENYTYTHARQNGSTTMLGVKQQKHNAQSINNKTQ